MKPEERKLLWTAATHEAAHLICWIAAGFTAHARIFVSKEGWIEGETRVERIETADAATTLLGAVGGAVGELIAARQEVSPKAVLAHMSDFDRELAGAVSPTSFEFEAAIKRAETILRSEEWEPLWQDCANALCRNLIA